MNGKLKGFLEKLKEKYNLLMGSPEPEEEEQAQKELIGIFEGILENLDEGDEIKNLAQELYEIIKNWDTLEQWFVEVEGLADKLTDFLSHFGLVESKGREQEIAQEASGGEEERQTIERNEEEILRKKRELEELERKMKELEEKERLLKQKEEELKRKEQMLLKQKKQQKHAEPVSEEGGPSKPKLGVPKLSIPKVKAPKKVITPSQPEVKIPNITPAPVKIVNKPVKIIPISGAGDKSKSPGIKIKPISSPPTSTGTSTNKIKIKPLTATVPPMGTNIFQEREPVIKPISPGTTSSSPQPNPKIKINEKDAERHKKRPMIKPITNKLGKASSEIPKAGPAMKPMKPLSRIRPVNGPKIVPIKGLEKPKVRPGVSPTAASQQSQIPTPQKGPVNLFDNKPKKGPVNLFDQPKKPGPINLFDQKKGGVRQAGAGPAKVGGISPVKVAPVKPVKDPAKIEKVVGSLEKIDFSKNAPKSINKATDSIYSKMSPYELYQELLRNESKRYYFDKNLKQLEERYKQNAVDEATYRGEKERLKFEIERCSNKIKEIRNIILGI